MSRNVRVGNVCSAADLARFGKDVGRAFKKIRGIAHAVDEGWAPRLR